MTRTSSPSSSTRPSRRPRVTVRAGNRGWTPTYVREAVADVAHFLSVYHPPAVPVMLALWSARAIVGADKVERVAYFATMAPRAKVKRTSMMVAGLGPQAARERGVASIGAALDELRLAIFREWVHLERWAGGRRFRSEVGVTVRVRALLREFHAQAPTAHRRVSDATECLEASA
jgi:hypothetical protein